MFFIVSFFRHIDSCDLHKVNYYYINSINRYETTAFSYFSFYLFLSICSLELFQEGPDQFDLLELARGPLHLDGQVALADGKGVGDVGPGGFFPQRQDLAPGAPGQPAPERRGAALELQVLQVARHIDGGFRLALGQRHAEAQRCPFRAERAHPEPGMHFFRLGRDD